MKYEQIEKLEGEKFRRLTGVRQATFNRMIEIGRKKISEKKQRVGEKASSA